MSWDDWHENNLAQWRSLKRLLFGAIALLFIALAGLALLQFRPDLVATFFYIVAVLSAMGIYVAIGQILNFRRETWWRNGGPGTKKRTPN